jgi:Amt family ammonium transporter
VAGLVAITPAAGYVTVAGALGIGLGAGAICYFAVSVVKARWGYDDSLDAFGVHGIGGMWGAIATGLWASQAVNPGGADGLFHGNAKQLGVQVVAVAVSVIYSFAASWVICKVVDRVMHVRVSEQDERVGLDLTQHREAGYTLID